MLGGSGSGDLRDIMTISRAPKTGSGFVGRMLAALRQGY